MTAPSLPAGLYLQPYREKVPGSSEPAKVAAFYARVDALQGVSGYFRGAVPHGFTLEFTPAEWQLWASAGNQRQLATGAAWGLDSSDPQGKGDRIGAVAALPDCRVSLLNAEGAFDENGAAVADTLCRAIRSKAPRSRLVNQSWPVPTSHADYPFGTFARYCYAFAEERYYNDWTAQYGALRVVTCEPWFDQSWATLERTLGPQRLARPHTPTVQGYGWTDNVVMDGITVLCAWDAGPVYVWSEWWPEDNFWLMARCVAALHAAGYSGPAAVWAFQYDNPPLVVDGRCGPATRAALGVA